MKIKKSDIILFVVFLVIGVAALLWFQINKSDGSRILITVDGNEYKTLNLNEDTTFEITQANGKKNTIVIDSGYVKMLEASCPDQLCVHQSKIHYNDEMIVCLPNYVIIQVVDGEEKTMDSITN